ncbi:hypothetical protein HHI36_002598, partial [Cryptolaemus montrouzieri]
VPSQAFVEVLEYLNNHERCNIPELRNFHPKNLGATDINFAKLKRRILCTLVQHGLLTKDGQFRTDFIRKNLYLGEPQKVDYLLQKCAHTRKTPDDTAFYALMCFFKHKSLKDIKNMKRYI